MEETPAAAIGRGSGVLWTHPSELSWLRALLLLLCTLSPLSSLTPFSSSPGVFSTLFKDQLKKHLRRCNAAKQHTPSCLTAGINSGGLQGYRPPLEEKVCAHTCTPTSPYIRTHLHTHIPTHTHTHAQPHTQQCATALVLTLRIYCPQLSLSAIPRDKLESLTAWLLAEVAPTLSPVPLCPRHHRALQEEIDSASNGKSARKHLLQQVGGGARLQRWEWKAVLCCGLCHIIPDCQCVVHAGCAYEQGWLCGWST